MALLLPAAAAAQPKKKSIPLALAFVNFIGKDAEEIAGQDVSALLALFDRVENLKSAPKQIPTCQVLFLYAHLEPDGTIRGTKWSVRDMVLLSKASIVARAEIREHRLHPEPPRHGFPDVLPQALRAHAGRRADDVGVGPTGAAGRAVDGRARDHIAGRRRRARLPEVAVRRASSPPRCAAGAAPGTGRCSCRKP